MGRPAKNPILNTLERDCPKCGQKILYETIYTCSRADAKGAKCVNCSRAEVASQPQVKAAKKEHIKKVWHNSEVRAKSEKTRKTPESIAKRKAKHEKFKKSPEYKEYKRKKSERLRASHADPNSGFNTPEYKRNRKDFALNGLKAAHKVRPRHSKGEIAVAKALEKYGFTLNISKLWLGRFLPDVVHSEKKLLVEYYGGYYHCDPRNPKYTPDYFHHRKKKTAQEVWDTDKRRVETALVHGYQIAIIWERDWKDDPGAEILRVLTQFGLDGESETQGEKKRD